MQKMCIQIAAFKPDVVVTEKVRLLSERACVFLQRVRVGQGRALSSITVPFAAEGLEAYSSTGLANRVLWVVLDP